MHAARAATLLTVLEEPVLRSVPEGVGPYAGEIIAGQDRPVTRIAAEAVASGALWRAEGEHVATVLDVLRTPDGHAVIVPQLARSIADLAAARAATGQALRPGEVVTIAVSVLRGTVAELAAHGTPLCPGDWWFDEQGAPQFVHLDDGEPADAAAVRVIRAVADASEQDAATSATLARVTEALADTERLPVSAPGVEGEVFALGPPEAVGTQVLARRGRSAPEPGPAVSASDKPAWQRLADAADGSLGEMVSQVVTSVWGALRHRNAGSKRPRRGVLLIAAACGALALAVGLLWPVDDGDRSPAAVSSTDGASTPASPDEASAPASPSMEPSAATADDTVVADDAVSAVSGLLDTARGCAGEAACLRPLLDADSALLQGGSVVRWDGAAFADAESRRLTLLDDVGGLVLIRAEDATGAHPSQVVAAVRGEKEWVLRDIRDVAQHPG